MNQQELNMHLMKYAYSKRSGKSKVNYSGLKNQNLDHVIIKNRNLTGITFQNSSLCFATISNCNLTDVSFENTNCKNIIFRNCIFNGVDFRNANLVGSSIYKCNTVDEASGKVYFVKENANPPKFDGTNLDNATIDNSSFIHSNIKNTSMKGVHIQSVNFDHSNLVNVDLSNSNLVGLFLRDSKCEKVNATYGDFVGSQISGTIVNCDFSRSKFKPSANNIQCSLRGQVHNSTLQHICFSSCQLEGVSFNSSNLDYSDFNKCGLQYASLNESSLKYARFCGGNLRRSKTRNCILDYSNFINVDLRQAIFKETSLDNSNFENCKNINYGYLGEVNNILSKDASILLREASIDDINNVIKRLGEIGYVEFGSSSKLKFSTSKNKTLYITHTKKTVGRIYESMIYGSKPNPNYAEVQHESITPRNISIFSIADILFGLYWLKNYDGTNRQDRFSEFDYDWELYL